MSIEAFLFQDTTVFGGITDTRVISIAFSEDGQRLTVGTIGNEIRAWHAADSTPHLSWVAHAG
jgi:hypothetical protein